MLNAPADRPALTHADGPLTILRFQPCQIQPQRAAFSCPLRMAFASTPAARIFPAPGARRTAVRRYLRRLFDGLRMRATLNSRPVRSPRHASLDRTGERQHRPPSVRLIGPGGGQTIQSAVGTPCGDGLPSISAVGRGRAGLCAGGAPAPAMRALTEAVNA